MEDKELREHLRKLESDLSIHKKSMQTYTFILSFVNYVLQIPMTLGSLFGMNVLGIPYADNPHGFWIITGWCMVFTTIELLIVFFLLKVVGKYL